MPTTISPASERLSSATTADARLEIDATRARQTERPATPFRDVLAGGVSLLMSGAEVATHVMAGPVMAAAVRDARVGAVGAISGGAGTSSAVAAATPSGAAGSAAVAAASGSSDMSGIQSMMQDGQSSNMQMLALQQQIQNESQQFTTVSNVMRAKYDTAKSAVSNIRA
ncbi:MAG TPA: hypothetical protein VGP64_01975 [Polyangia bacterium]|jgi:hypothetical protein